jgi:hypothetical protein
LAESAPGVMQARAAERLDGHAGFLHRHL